jgi:nucleotide-binding universal stress UspA family protein
MSHILCVVDGSAPACRAARKAAALAASLDSDITFVSFARPGRIGPAVDAYRRAEGLQGDVPLFLSPATSDCLDIALREASTAGNRRPHRLVRAGAPSSAIPAAVAEVGADTVVLGRHTGTRPPLFRSVATTVMDRTRATVILVG